MICMYKAIRMLPLSDISTISMCSLVFIAILAYYMLKDPITIVHIGTCILTFVGVVIICRPQFIFGANHVSDNNKRTMGIIITVISTFLVSISAIYRRILKTTPITVTCSGSSITIVIIGSIFLTHNGGWMFPWNLITWLLLIVQAILGILMSWFMLLSARYETPGPLSLVRGYGIVLSFVWDVTIFGERIIWTSIVGSCLVITAIVIVAMNTIRQESPERFREIITGKICCIGNTTTNNIA